MASIAVIGAGAIGGYVAASAAQAGHDVQLCVRSPLPTLRVDVGGVLHHPAVRFVRQPVAAEPVDCIVLTTKAPDSAAAAGWFATLRAPHTTIVVMQNGVDHVERIQPLAPGAVVVAALVYILADRVSAGRIIHRTGRRIVLPAGPEANLAAELLAGGLIDVERSPDFFTASWRKLLLNVAANPITALTGQRLGVLEVPEVRQLAEGILREAVAAGNACGARLSEQDVTATLAAYGRFGGDAGTSMLADRLAGRPTEYELITAAVVRAGQRHGIPVPLNTVLLALLRGSELVGAPTGGPARRLASVAAVAA